MTTLNKVNIKGVEYDLGGSGESYRTMETLMWTEFHEDDNEHIFLYFDFDNTGSQKLLVDWTKPVRIDFLAPDGSVNGYFSLNVTTYNQITLSYRSFRGQEAIYELSNILDGAVFSNNDSANFLSVYLHIQGEQSFIEEVLGGLAEKEFDIIVNYIPVNEYSPILLIEI